MKTRRVLVTVEIETDINLNSIKNYYSKGWAFTVHQVQVNVIRPSKKVKKPKKGGSPMR